MDQAEAALMFPKGICSFSAAPSSLDLFCYCTPGSEEGALLLMPILVSFNSNKCLSGASNYSFLHAIWFSQVFFPLQDPLQRIFSFYVFSFLYYSICFLAIILPSRSGSRPEQRHIPCGATSGTPSGTWE